MDHVCSGRIRETRSVWFNAKCNGILVKILINFTSFIFSHVDCGTNGSMKPNTIFRWSLSQRTLLYCIHCKNQWNEQAFLLCTTNAIIYNQVHSHDSQFFLLFLIFPLSWLWCRDDAASKVQKTNWSSFQHFVLGWRKNKIMNASELHWLHQ